MKPAMLSLLGFSCATLLAVTCLGQDSPEGAAETSTADIEQCVTEHDRARQLHLQEQWLAARTAMLACAAARCPLAIASDCRAWLEELEHTLPTLLVVVEREEPVANRAPLRVELDGSQLLLPDPPTPLELVPGAHRLRFEIAGQPPIERQFVLQKGEKNHLEQVRFAPPPPLLSPSVAPAPPVAERPISAATYWFAGGALAAFAGSAAWLALGVREHRDAQVQCAPACGRGTRNSIETKLVLADVAGGVGIALTGLALYSYLRRPVVTSVASGASAPILASGPSLASTGHDLTLNWLGQF